MFREPLPVRRTEDRIVSESSRVLAKPYFPGGEARIRKVVDRVLALSEEEANNVLEQVIADFATRHKNIWQIFGRNFKHVSEYVPKDADLSEERRCLIGAYFTHEYSVQAAAFFNPSIVPHLDQSYLDEGSLRVILSFRSTGEGLEPIVDLENLAKPLVAGLALGREDKGSLAAIHQLDAEMAFHAVYRLRCR